MNKTGIIGIGYVFTIVITAIFLAGLTIVISSMINASTQSSEALELLDVSRKIANGIEEAIYVGISNPEASYSKSIILPERIHGLKYTIVATRNAVYLNSTFSSGTEVPHVKTDIIESPFYITGKVQSSVGIVRIVYENNKIILTS